MDRASAEPTVRRATPAQPMPAVHQKEIRRVIEERARPAADVAARRMKAQLKALAPQGKLIEQDPSAVAAVRELQTLSLQSAEARAAGDGETRFLRGAVHPARPGLNIFGPPYDWQVLLPTEGENAASASDVGSGNFSVNNGFGGDAEGYRIATAGVSMALQAEQGGFARIAPVLKYDYTWDLHCHLFSAYTEGWCDLIVQDGSGSVLPHGRRTVKLWSHTSETGADGEGADQIYIPDIETTVALAAGQIFHVTLTGTAVVVDSGSMLFGFSHADADMKNWAPWFTVTF